MTQITPIFKGFIEKGKLRLEDEKAYRAYILGFTDDTEVEVVVRKRKKRRGLDQNGLYWAYLRLIKDETGNDIDIMHELFKNKFIEPERLTMFGLEAEKRKTTTLMSPAEFADYIKKIEVLTGILCDKDNIFY